MGVYIKGMEMPKNCRDCRLKMNCDDCEGFECVCLPLHTQIGYLNDLLTDKRRDDCPLVPFPEPHGRLGDLDELKTAFPCGEYVKTESVRATIDHMRTIIPASEEAE